MPTAKEVNANTEARIARQAKFKQARDITHVINIDDGRLMPNVENLRKHASYRLYTGPLDADLTTRMRWLKGQRLQMPRLVDSSPQVEFDMGTATKDEIILFALNNYGAVIDEKFPLKVVKTKCAEAAALYESQQESATA